LGEDKKEADRRAKVKRLHALARRQAFAARPAALCHLDIAAPNCLSNFKTLDCGWSRYSGLLSPAYAQPGIPRIWSMLQRRHGSSTPCAKH